MKAEKRKDASKASINMTGLHIFLSSKSFQIQTFGNFSNQELKAANNILLSLNTRIILNEEEVRYCEGMISEKECVETLKSIPNEKHLELKASL